MTSLLCLCLDRLLLVVLKGGVAICVGVCGVVGFRFAFLTLSSSPVKSNSDSVAVVCPN